MNIKSPSIKGLGNDIISIDRIKNAIDRNAKLVERVFTPKEKNYCLKYKDPYPHFAVRFAAKEAIAKAFGSGLGREVGWQDIEIFNDKNGKPYVSFSKKIQKKFSDPEMMISLSHCDHFATAVAIWI